MADSFFEMEEQTSVQESESTAEKTSEKPKDTVKFLISTDSFSNYGLDLIFDLAKDAGFDGIDLAMRKSNDAQNVAYVKKLAIKHELPVKSIQVSDNVNQKELNKALDLCEAT
jgi:sugar phosphate isomerase/epimerase